LDRRCDTPFIVGQGVHEVRRFMHGPFALRKQRLDAVEFLGECHQGVQFARRAGAHGSVALTLKTRRRRIEVQAPGIAGHRMKIHEALGSRAEVMRL
jgi:hypothetical protein